MPRARSAALSIGENKRSLAHPVRMPQAARWEWLPRGKKLVERSASRRVA